MSTRCRNALRLDEDDASAAILDPAAQTLITRDKKEVDELSTPLDERFSRLFGCQVTS